MNETSNQKAFRSALFIDFDNIYICLKTAKGEKYAEAFATNATQWLAWLHDCVPIDAGPNTEIKRRILVRQCYFNSEAFGQYRDDLLKGGITIMDCPSMTRRGKTSTDINMAVDILDLLDHKIHYDEFILFSADVDFRPVLLKLRKWDRRTVVLAVGPKSDAYGGACDVVIDANRFIDEALLSEIFEKPTESLAPPRPVNTPQDSDLINRCSSIVLGVVRKSSMPVVMATLASRIRNIYPDAAHGWFGYYQFRMLLGALNLKGLKISDVSPGYVYDPNRHTAPSEALPMERTYSSDTPLSESEEIQRKLFTRIGIPPLATKQYHLIFKNIEAVIHQNSSLPWQFISKYVKDACKPQEPLISRNQIGAVVEAIIDRGYEFSGHQASAAELSQWFYNYALEQCESADPTLSDQERNLIKALLLT